jgi:hypothetical protein
MTGNIQFVRYSWKNTVVTHSIVVINSDGSFISSRIVTALSRRAVLIGSASQVFTTTICVQWTILIVYRSLDISKSSMLKFEQVLLVTGRPACLPHRLTGNYYRDFLLHISAKAIGSCTTGSQSTNVVHAWWCSGTFSRVVRDILNNTCHGRWIGTGGSTAWEPRPPDLNPLDFYLWRNLKSLVCAAPVDIDEALHHRIGDACQTIRK